MNLLPIPWMKQKLEIIYDVNLYGSLYILFNEIKHNLHNNDANTINNLLNSYNILVDDYHPLYLYFPLELNYYLYNLMVSFKSLYKDNVYIILGGYKFNHPDLNELDCLANLCSKYNNLDCIVNNAYLINDDKSYEILKSLSDTQNIYINPLSSCLISGITLNYHLKQPNPNNVNHISFVNLMDDSSNDNLFKCHLKGLTNKNNNFNYYS